MSFRGRSVIFTALLVLVGLWWLNRPVVDGQFSVTVVSGDTLGKIARKHGVSVTALQMENGLKNDLIQIGDVLLIPLVGTKKPEVNLDRRLKKNSKTVVQLDDKLTMPRAKACLAGPSQEDETGMAASEGLSVDEVTRSMQRFLPKLINCVPDSAPSGQLVVEFIVGCDGLVSEVDADDDPGWPAAISDCVVDTLRFVEFPAHALPDGEYFRYPIGFVDQPSVDGIE